MWLSRENNGITTVRAHCDASLASLFKAAFSEGTNPDTQPRFLSEEDRQRGTTMIETRTGERVEKFEDPRSREQLQHDILVGLLTAGLRSTGLAPGEMRSLARVNVVITRENLDTGRGVGWVDDLDEPISAATVQQLACDAELREIVLGPGGEILELGKAQRLFTAAQRIALAVRDGGCTWYDCTAPPGWCHAHHVEEWEADDGPTDINNGALLCPAHHHQLHHSGFRMRMHNGRPQLLAPPWLDPRQRWQTVGGSRAIHTRQLTAHGVLHDALHEVSNERTPLPSPRSAPVGALAQRTCQRPPTRSVSCQRDTLASAAVREATCLPICWAISVSSAANRTVRRASPATTARSLASTTESSSAAAFAAGSTCWGEAPATRAPITIVTR